MSDPTITPALIADHGLSVEEFDKIKSILGREPTYAELGVFSVMWSEHCSYKNSIVLLKTLPREGSCMLAKAGEENAGVVDWGNGLAVVFKIESHNHPSAVEPYQGAATGVGGILRDIFTMGARPIAVLDSLRFGDPNNPRVRYLVDGVVRGVGDYGNCFGVPNIGGETIFEEAYTGNPLVNAMAIGIVRTDKIAKAAASLTGAPVMIIGSKTGRDGIHGATFASEELSEKSEGRRPQVQIGDPFTEKLLLEATLEMIDADLLVGIQDMGAAGITCSCSETAFRGGKGIHIDTARVPVRELGMTPYEILLSESQERMLAIVRPGCQGDVERICQKWQLEAAPIGVVTDSGRFTVDHDGKRQVDIPADSLALGGRVPQYKRAERRPEYLDQLAAFDPLTLPVPNDCGEALKRLLASPNLADKTWVYRQYDQSVRTGTAVGPGMDAGVVRIRKTNTALAAVIDGNGRYCYLNPRRGAQVAVAEAARNLVCVGARPLAVTNCLNFGNPHKPEMYYQFAECVRGMGDACRAFGTPVTGGNVSFYNEDPSRAVFPTPTIGMIGKIEDLALITTADFKEAGDGVALVGATKNELGGSEYLKVIHNAVAGSVPALEFEAELRVQRFVANAIRSGWIRSAHDCSDGGLAVTLFESCLGPDDRLWGLDADLSSGNGNLRPDALLFGEIQSRIVISFELDARERLQAAAASDGVPFWFLGRVASHDRFRLHPYIDESIGGLRAAHLNAFPALMDEVKAATAA
ncbi:MAG: phosphoribosylformylglycinamidine synthase subunit PurL [candidate division Zixibacteria bacterium]|nr:phosphoribosylformylglycinamidine synthase subunit PurL [candidate division Zixibacteria bacterium]